MYSGEYNVFDVTLECISTPGRLNHGGNRTRNLWDTVLLWDTQLAEHWTSIPKVAGSIPTVVRLTFSLPGVDIHSE